MSLEFDLKFEEYRNNDPTAATGKETDPHYYPSGGHVRNLAFVLQDGTMQFFNYSYLVTCTYQQEAGAILLEFTTHHITLKGQRLETLFFELMVQANKIIRCAEARYEALEDAQKPVVREIHITEKQA
jgi:hypothetical protein